MIFLIVRKRLHWDEWLVWLVPRVLGRPRPGFPQRARQMAPSTRNGHR